MAKNLKTFFEPPNRTGELNRVMTGGCPKKVTADKAANNGVNCHTCRSHARELSHLVCTDFSVSTTDIACPAHPPCGFKAWKPMDLGAREPVANFGLIDEDKE